MAGTRSNNTRTTQVAATEANVDLWAGPFRRRVSCAHTFHFSEAAALTMRFSIAHECSEESKRARGVRDQEGLAATGSHQVHLESIELLPKMHGQVSNGFAGSFSYPPGGLGHATCRSSRQE